MPEGHDNSRVPLFRFIRSAGLSCGDARSSLVSTLVNSVLFFAPLNHHIATRECARLSSMHDFDISPSFVLLRDDFVNAIGDGVNLLENLRPFHFVVP